MRWLAAAAALAGAGATPPFVPSSEPNMNGEYLLSQTPGASHTQERFPTHYRDYPGGVRYFDVYSPPVKTLYSQVFWTGLDPVALPDEVVQRYAAGGAMAVVGFELDQVRRTPQGDVPVPISVAYNHHFESTMIGGSARLEKITLTGPEDPRVREFGLNHGHNMARVSAGDEHWIVRGGDAAAGVPYSQSFGAANGGEVRKSFHGYAPGFAQVIKSPRKLQVTPMQIDTWNRDKMNVSGGPFVSGPVPRNSWAPTSGPDAVYSGLLECPVTTRLRKDIDGGYDAITSGSCGSQIATAAECFQGTARQLSLIAAGVAVANRTVDDPSLPPGCSAAADPGRPAVTVTFNKNTQGGAQCGAGAATRAGVARSLVTLNVTMDIPQGAVTIRMTGPDGVWFGVGFNATLMGDAPWTIVVDGAGNVTERKLAEHAAGSPLAPSVSVVSSTAAGGLRTVELRRGLQGKTADYYTFDPRGSALLPFINAVGSGPTFAYHKDKTPSTLALLPVAAKGATGACICASNPAPFGQGKGTFSYVPTNQTGEMGRPTKIGFGNKCEPQPREDLLAMHNPTCDVRTYLGGQTACHHMFSLLDADQDIPWADQPLEYHLKFRFWYQDYNESYHTQVKRTTWGIGSPVEYDVPKCAEGVMGCAQQPDGNWVHTITGTYRGGGKLVAAHFHCHAPTCLSVKMYRNDTGELLCEERPVYGGTGRIPEARFDERGFILQPPCLWGSAEQGLQAPPDVNGVMLHTVKTANATYGHHGEMAWQQMFYY